MKRSELEHIIRAAAEISGDSEVVVLGSQSILGQYPNAPAELLRSMEADVYPRNMPERWELIDGSIGELSPFHETFGYYAQGVELGVAILPTGWEARLIRVQNPNTRGHTGLCLEIHDLLVAKLVAGRPKDVDFARAAIAHRLATLETLRDRLENTEVDEARLEHARARVVSLAGT